MAIEKLKIHKSPGMDQNAVEIIQCREGEHHVPRYTGLFKMIVGGFNNLSYTIHLRLEYVVASMDL